MKVIIKEAPDCLDWVTLDELTYTYHSVGKDWIVWVRKLMFEGFIIKISKLYTRLGYKIQSMTYVDDTTLKFTIKKV